MEHRSDIRADIRDFLARRRAQLTPEQVGLPTSGRRRVPGLRREEVAVLAGVSTEWYTRLEKGHICSTSPGPRSPALPPGADARPSTSHPVSSGSSTP
jgi:hypothetical protein